MCLAGVRQGVPYDTILQVIPHSSQKQNLSTYLVLNLDHWILKLFEIIVQNYKPEPFLF